VKLKHHFRTHADS